MFKHFLKYLKASEFWTMVVIALVMLNNIEHLAFVHYRIARHLFPTYQLNWLHSILVVVIIELSIIVLVNKGQKTFAFMYTLMLFVLSLMYYPLDEYWINGQYGLFISAIVYSLMFTISIYYFACMAAQKSWENGKIMTLTRTLDESRAELQQIRAKLQETTKKWQDTEENLQLNEKATKEYLDEIKKFATDYNQLKDELQQNKKELQQLRLYRQQIEASCTCEHCGTKFETEASKRSHAGKCKGKEERKAA